MPVSTLPLRPRSSSMTFWSRYDPVCMHRGNTDNWAKLRVRVNVSNSMDSLNFTLTGDAAAAQTSWQGPAARFQRTAEGGVKRVAEPRTFGELLSSEMRGRLPGDLGHAQPSAGLRRSWMDNQYQLRARQGFRYWLIERPLPTKYGRYGTGSFKTVLGIGNAPRT